MQKIILEEEIFGELLPFIRDEEITDINYNGSQLWIDHLQRGRYMVKGLHLTDMFLNRLAMRLANAMNVNFNPYEPLLEAESENLRISILHESVTGTGKSLSIRKTPAIRRLAREKMVREGYCLEELDIFMENAVRAGMTVIVAGLPGAGKTEYVKLLTSYIPPWEKVITIEDNLEIHYRAINPGKDCIEIKVGELFSYQQAIKASMRQLPKWILLSEARSVEVAFLLESMSTGTHCLTTIHADDVRKIPDRICNMIKKDVSNDVYTFCNIGVLVQSAVSNTGKIRRRIAQVGLFFRHEEKNTCTLLYENGAWLTKELPPDIRHKFEFAQIPRPFEKRQDDPS